MKRNRLSSGLILLLFLAWLPFAKGQTLTSVTVIGTVVDSSGAVVPNASITVTQIDNGAVSHSSSTSSGEYRFPFLSPGNYEISAEAGSLTATPIRIQLLVGQEKSVNLKLA